MGMLDQWLAHVTENVDVANLAAKVGLTPEQVEQAISALGVAHPQPGDTAQAAAASTGLPAGTLQQIIGHIGGEGSLGRFAEMLQSQTGGDHGIEGLLGGIAGRFLHKG